MAPVKISLNEDFNGLDVAAASQMLNEIASREASADRCHGRLRL